jgi:serine phosphatase RsbU (regulator of sigma subunit)
VPGTTSNSARVAWLCVAALGVFVIWLAAPASSNIGIGFFYAVPVGLATWWFGRRAGVIALLACGVLYCIGALVDPIEHFAAAIAVRMLAFAGVVALVAILRERQLALERSADELESIRAALAPAALPHLPGVDAAASFVPSELGVSGDFYLLTNGPDRSAVAIVGDVVGHGPAAARLATFVRARFAALAAGTSDPAELLTLVNGALADRSEGERELVSAVCLRLRGDDLRWAIAGHPPPLLLPGLEELRSASSTYLLGAESGLELGNREATLRRGEGVIAYTDGATDVRRGGAMLGLEGLRGFLAPLAEAPAPAIISRTEKEILEWAEKPIRDDLCLLALKPR